MDVDRRELLLLALAGALARPAAGHAAARDPLALVTADREAHVAVVSLGRGRVVQRLRTRAGPRSIQAAPGGRAIVGHATVGAVSLLEGRPLRVRRVLGGFGAPRYAAVHPGGALAYVSDGDHGEVAVVDLRAARVVRRIAVGAGARHLTLDPAGTRLWVALGSSAAEIVVLGLAEPRRPRVVRRIHPPFLVHDVGFSPSGRRVWVTAGRVAQIAVYARHGRKPLRLLGADAAPQHLSFGPTEMYVSSGEAGTVRVHRLSDGAARRRTRVPIGSYNIQRAGRRVLTPSLGTGALSVLDPRGAVLASIPVARAAHDACVV